MNYTGLTMRMKRECLCTVIATWQLWTILGDKKPEDASPCGIGDLQITQEYNDYSQKAQETLGQQRAEACEQMQKGSGNKSVLLIPVLNCEILSILDR